MVLLHVRQSIDDSVIFNKNVDIEFSAHDALLE